MLNHHLRPLLRPSFVALAATRAGRPNPACTAALACAVIVAAGAFAPAASAGTSRPAAVAADLLPTSPGYLAPVDAPVVERFRPPATPYGPGNRGIDYATWNGEPVRAAGGGTVVFAGEVARARHVTILHADGLRTTYSYLASISVVAGQRVRRGDSIGTAGERLHFGVRDPGGNYLDPEELLAGRLIPVPHLVPGGDDGAPEGSGGPGGSRRPGGGLPAAPASGDRRVPGQPFHPDLRLGLERAVRPLDPGLMGARLLGGLAGWALDQRDCTPADEPVAKPPARRIVILVGGIGTADSAASVRRVDTRSLGYGDGDVVQYSYRGGRVPPAAHRSNTLDPLPQSTYGAEDTQQDLSVSSANLSSLILAVAAAEPGVPIDLIAHSQGGVVARLALDDLNSSGRLPTEVSTLVTLSSPHRGAPLATLAGELSGSPMGPLVARIPRAAGYPLDPESPSIGQLSESAPTIHRLSRTSPPGSVGFVSVAARGDLVVPATQTIVSGRRRAVIPLMGTGAHDAIVDDPRSTREMALAVARRPPTCEPAGEAALDLLVSEGVAAAEHSGVVLLSPLTLPLPGS